MKIRSFTFSVILVWTPSLISVCSASDVAPAVYALSVYTKIEATLPDGTRIAHTYRTGGSGVCVHPDGYILTNHHVVHPAAVVRRVLAHMYHAYHIGNAARKGRHHISIRRVYLLYKAHSVDDRIYLGSIVPDFVFTYRDTKRLPDIRVRVFETRAVRGESENNVRLLRLGNRLDLAAIKLRVTAPVPHVSFSSGDMKFYRPSNLFARPTALYFLHLTREKTGIAYNVRTGYLYQKHTRYYGPIMEVALTTWCGDSGSGVFDQSDGLVGILRGWNARAASAFCKSPRGYMVSREDARAFFERALAQEAK